MTPRLRSVARLKVLAVANTVAPHCWAIWTAASPTPPLAAWISTLSPGFSCAQSNASRTVSAAAGMVAASTALTPSGMGASSCAGTLNRLANAPCMKP